MAEGKGGSIGDVLGSIASTIGDAVIPQTMNSYRENRAYAGASDPLRQFMAMSAPQAQPALLAQQAQRKPFTATTFNDGGTTTEEVPAGPVPDQTSFQGLPSTSFNKPVGGNFTAADAPRAVQSFMGQKADLQSDAIQKLMGAPSVQRQLAEMEMTRMFAPKKAPVVTKPGDVARDPDTNQIVYSNPEKPEGFKVGQTRDVQRGNEKVTQEYDGTSWKDIASGPAFAPHEPAQPQVQEFFDEESGRPYKAERQPDGSWKRVGGFSTPSKTFNNDQNKAAGFANTMQSAEDALAKLYETGSDGKPLLDKSGAPVAYLPNRGVQIMSGTPLIGGALEKITSSPQYQQYKQKAMDWTLAILRQESGANVPDSEAAKYWTTYFPQPGDDESTIKAKAESRAVKMQGVVAASGGAYDALRGQPHNVPGTQTQRPPAVAKPPAAAPPPPGAPPGAKLGKDPSGAQGWYSPDPLNPGKFIKW